MGNEEGSGGYGGAVVLNVFVHAFTGVSEFNFFVEGYDFSSIVFLLVGDISDKLFGNDSNGGGKRVWRGMEGKVIVLNVLRDLTFWVFESIAYFGSWGGAEIIFVVSWISSDPAVIIFSIIPLL